MTPEFSGEGITQLAVKVLIRDYLVPVMRLTALSAVSLCAYSATCGRSLVTHAGE